MQCQRKLNYLLSLNKEARMSAEVVRNYISCYSGEVVSHYHFSRCMLAEISHHTCR